MDESAAVPSEDLAERTVRYTKEQLDALVSQTEDYVRQHPAQSLFYAFVAGLILDRLPVGRVLNGVFRLSLFAIKPAILIYSATKLYQALEEES
jgi:hypothetical protein